MLASIATIATVIISSINVNPEDLDFCADISFGIRVLLGLCYLRSIQVNRLALVLDGSVTASDPPTEPPPLLPPPSV